MAYDCLWLLNNLYVNHLSSFACRILWQLSFSLRLNFEGRPWHFLHVCYFRSGWWPNNPFFWCDFWLEALLNMKASANTVQPAATSTHTHTQFDADKIFKKDVIDSSQSCVEPAGHVWYFQDFCEMHYLSWLLFIQWFSCMFIKGRLMMQRWCWGNSSLSSTSRGSSNWRWTAILEYGKGEEACLMIDCEYEMALALWFAPCFQLAVGVEVWISNSNERMKRLWGINPDAVPSLCPSMPGGSACSAGDGGQIPCNSVNVYRHTTIRWSSIEF